MSKINDNFNLLCFGIKKDMLKFFPKHIRHKITLKNILYRVINMLLFGLLLSIYIYIPFISYMQYHDFFSYDIFSEKGIFAIGVFSFFIAFLTIGFSLILNSGIGIAIAYGLNNIKMPKPNVYVIIFNIVVLLILLLVTINMFDGTAEAFNRVSWMFFLFFLSLIISSHIAISLLIYSSVKLQLYSTFMTFCILLPVLLFFIFPSPSSQLVSITLSSFGVGGSIPAAIINKNTDKCLETTLIFLSPENIYFKNKNNVNIVVGRDDYVIGIGSRTYNKVICEKKTSIDDIKKDANQTMKK